MPTETARIAIIDDDAAVGKALSRLLKARSFQPEVFASAGDFLASLSAGSPDCLILDHQMPDMTGLELQHHLARSNIRIPTIIVTAHDERDLHMRCMSAGAFTVLLKPIEGGRLVSTIHAAIGQGSPSR